MNNRMVTINRHDENLFIQICLRARTPERQRLFKLAFDYKEHHFKATNELITLDKAVEKIVTTMFSTGRGLNEISMLIAQGTIEPKNEEKVSD